MKYLTMTFFCVILGFSGLVSAATLSWTNTQQNSSITLDNASAISVQYGFGNSTESFEHTYTYSTDSPGVTTSNYLIELLNERINITSITLDGIAMVFQTDSQRWFGEGVLGQANHTIKIAGDLIGIGQQYQIFVDSTDGTGVIPIPGAVWLFGSAMVGLMGLRKQKQH